MTTALKIVCLRRTILSTEFHLYSINGYHDDDVESWPYPDYGRLKRTHQHIKIKFFDKSFGHACSVCDRLWFQRDLKSPSSNIKRF